MGKKPIDPRLIEALEVCRPGSDDLKDPALAPLAAEMERDAELAELYTRLQQTDAALAEAFVDVPVPEGAQQRLLEALGAASGGEHEGADTPGEEEKPAVVPRRVSRRRWLAVAGSGLAAAAAILVAALILSNGDQDGPSANRLAEALEFFRRDARRGGQPVLPDKAYPGDLPPSPAIAAPHYRNAQWRHVHGFLDQQEAVAYDFTIALPGGGTTAATLYVVRLQEPGMPASPPPTLANATNALSTGGVSAVAWQSGELLYVLAFEGDKQAVYEQILIQPPSGPIA